MGIWSAIGVLVALPPLLLIAALIAALAVRVLNWLDPWKEPQRKPLTPEQIRAARLVRRTLTGVK